MMNPAIRTPLVLFVLQACFIFSGCSIYRTIPRTPMRYESHVLIKPFSTGIDGVIPTNAMVGKDLSAALFTIEWRLTSTHSPRATTVVSRRTLQSFTKSFTCHVEDIAYFRNPQPVVIFNWNAEQKTLTISTEILNTSAEHLPVEHELYLPDLLGIHQALAITSIIRVSESNRETFNTSQASDLAAAKGPSIAYPESLIEALSSEEQENIRFLSERVKVPSDSPGSVNTEVGRAYATWYRRGYAYAYVTSNTDTGHPHPQPKGLEDATLSGWYAGNRDGGVSRLNQSIGDATDDFIRRIKPDRN